MEVWKWTADFVCSYVDIVLLTGVKKDIKGENENEENQKITKYGEVLQHPYRKHITPYYLGGWGNLGD